MLLNFCKLLWTAIFSYWSPDSRACSVISHIYMKNTGSQLPIERTSTATLLQAMQTYCYRCTVWRHNALYTWATISGSVDYPYWHAPQSTWEEVLCDWEANEVRLYWWKMRIRDFWAVWEQVKFSFSICLQVWHLLADKAKTVGDHLVAVQLAIKIKNGQIDIICGTHHKARKFYLRIRSECCLEGHSGAPSKICYYVTLILVHSSTPKSLLARLQATS